MAGNPYHSNSSGLYSVEDDIDDYAFLNHPKTGATGYMLPNAPGSNNLRSSYPADDLEERRQQLLEKKKEIEQRTVQSTQRSLSYLRNSEEVGRATAEELLRQREQLERTEKRLDDINSTLRISKKHIQSLKSVFGGLINKFTGGPSTQVPSSLSSTEYPPRSFSKDDKVYSNSPLDEPISEFSDRLHPGLRVRGLYDEEETINRPHNGDHQRVIDENLDVMMGSISRLKGLANNLGEEIGSHNELIENVIGKAERADTSISRQNKDIKRLLK